MRRIRSHLSYANVISTLCLFLLLTGGTAVALSGTNTVFTDDIANDTVPPSGENPAGGLAAADLRPGSVGSSETANESLTGADIKNRSGLETCAPPTTKYGPICAHSDGADRTWDAAAQYCAGLDLRLPSNSEARRLAVNHNVPGVGTSGPIFFWTDDETYTEDAEGHIAAMYEEGGFSRYFSHESISRETVCVTDPSA